MNKPTLHTETANYRLETQGSGLFFTLTRKADNASAFFQDDDAALWARNMDALERIPFWAPGNSFDRSFDVLCSGYDEILEPAP
jgi:hypothetical protein